MRGDKTRREIRQKERSKPTITGLEPHEGDSRTIVAIIPAYNEAETLANVISDARPFVDDILVINDASTDSTEAIAREHADSVVTHPLNMGVGSAVHTGYEAAVKSAYDIVIQIDADGQHNPSYIPKLIQKMDETNADMVIGSRWLNGSYKDYNWVRRAGIRFFTWEANVFGRLDITDVTSGYRAYKVEMLEHLNPPDNSHWALEQTLEAARKGFSIKEVSIPMPPATEGSQFDLETLLKYPLRMILTTLKVLLFR